MSSAEPWVNDGNAALLTDLYQLTMLQAYWREGMEEEGVFSLFARRLPSARNYLLACGLDDVLRYLERLRFTGEALDYLSSLDPFSTDFLDWLGAFRFTGDVHAVPEGTPVFANEPLLEVTAPIPQAQLVETFIMNQVHLQTVLASKAARVVEAARGRPVVDFGLRRMHGTDAGMKAARAFHVAGVAATSNVLAGRVYGLQVTGTMAHSYVQAHDDELEAFRAFAALYPTTTLLVDTYDTLEAVGKVVRLAREMGDGFAVRAIRLDSGDLVRLAFDARRILDEAGLLDVEIFASGGLDEHEVDRVVTAGAPITGFGVGTGMGVSSDAPSIDIAYKLSSYAGRGRLKLSPGKPILPGRKQVFRMEEGDLAVGDVIARAEEDLPGRPLLATVMQGGKRVAAGRRGLDEARARAREEIGRLPARVRALERADPPYPVALSPALEKYASEMVELATGGPR
ncbi:MAG TPA: nicotinate phosphoribosyltransferase [Gemmatimonadota bacterium]|nr:nicotinate phosphoribosyltransferase [Gemmatimonadota bacterium]